MPQGNPPQFIVNKGGMEGNGPVFHNLFIKPLGLDNRKQERYSV